MFRYQEYSSLDAAESFPTTRTEESLRAQMTVLADILRRNDGDGGIP